MGAAFLIDHQYGHDVAAMKREVLAFVGQLNCASRACQTYAAW